MIPQHAVLAIVTVRIPVVYVMITDLYKPEAWYSKAYMYSTIPSALVTALLLAHQYMHNWY
jgi:hypothetical protein